MDKLYIRVVEQMCSYEPVAHRLKYMFNEIREAGGEVVNVIETKVSNTNNNQGFIVLFRAAKESKNLDEEIKEMYNESQGFALLHCLTAAKNYLQTVADLYENDNSTEKLAAADLYMDVKKMLDEYPPDSQKRVRIKGIDEKNDN